MSVSKPSGERPVDRVSKTLDLIAFVAVLVVGWVLIGAVHAGPATLTAFGTAAAGLYTSWRRR